MLNSVSGTKLSHGFQEESQRLKLIDEAEKVESDPIEVKKIVTAASSDEDAKDVQSSEDVVSATDVQQSLTEVSIDVYVRKNIPEEPETTTTPTTTYGGDPYVPPSEEETYTRKGIGI